MGLWNAVKDQPQLTGLNQQFGRYGGLRIGLMGGGAQNFAGEAVQHLHQHLLFVRERQVEQAITARGARRLALATTRRRIAETAAAAGVEQLLERLAQLEAVRPIGLGHLAQHGKGMTLNISTHGRGSTR